MINYVDALKNVLENTHVLQVEEKPLTKCIGQVCAEDVRSGYALPMTATSGPDGYAVRSEDISSASRDNPASLRIIGTVRAGFLSKRSVTPGTTMRIMTGSAVPDGADCVVRFEDTDEPKGKNGPNPGKPSRVKIFVSQKSGDNMRQAGSNVSAGSLVMRKGTAVGPAQISALAAVGKTSIKVFRRPVFAVIATGDELISWKKQLTPGKVYNCNTEAVAALVTHYGGVPCILGMARDKEDSLKGKIQQGLTADAIITSGGVSMGDYDIVRLFIGNNGRLILAKINMGPGASFAFGMIESNAKETPVPIFGLAGPPVGCLNNFEIFVRPALMKMMGYGSTEHPVVEAFADDAVPGKRPMAFVRWTSLYKKQGMYRVVINTPNGMLGGMTTANSMTIIPENTEIRKGDKIKVMPLDWCLDYQI
jgi:molybdopterin molybdotransferase